MDSDYRGTIGRYHWESTPWWPELVRPPEGAPNVLLVVLDDVGFAQVGCFGSDIETPVLDGLADDGVRFTNFHTTSLCSPTRACLLTGRNHHSAGMGRITELATGFPGYDARIPRSCGFLPEMLVPKGYAAWAVGKWHLTPEDECHLAASRERWPLSRGFERFYGFFGGETHQFSPALVHDSHQVAPWGGYDDGYHLTEDLVDHAIGYIDDLRAIDVDKPFFLYFCTGACHAPHQAPAEWIERYRGRFDAGWDAWRETIFARQLASGVIPEGTQLSPRPEWVPPWDSLGSDTQRLYARFMEAFAGYLSHTDHHLGRLLAHLDRTGDLDNTVVMVLSDNGASSEGGPTGSVNDHRLWNLVPKPVEEAVARIDEIGGPRCHNNYPWGWTVAGNTPFRRWKREVHEGGVADPLIVHWPRGITRGNGLRRQYTHAIDVAATILDLARVEPPRVLNGIEQKPIEGTSFAAALREPDAPEHRERQYFEMFGCRALYDRGWKAVTFHPIQFDEPGLDKVGWELYRVTDDPAECNDLAAEHPDHLTQLIDAWWEEAERYQVLPLDNRPFSDFVMERPPQLPARPRYVYRANRAAVPEPVAVNLKNRSHAVIADIEVPASGVEGVIVTQGSLLGGWTLFVDDGRLRYVHNLCTYEFHRVESDTPLAPGPHHVEFHFTKTGEHTGEASLLVDGDLVAKGSIPRFTPTRFALAGAGLTVGYDAGLPVCDDYRSPFAFTGGLDEVVIEVDGEPWMDPDAEAVAAIRSQ
jgi:arylsulfatase